MKKKALTTGYCGQQYQMQQKDQVRTEQTLYHTPWLNYDHCVFEGEQFLWNEICDMQIEAGQKRK